MAINSVHNRIAFPRLTNNQTGMLMKMTPPEKKEETKPPVIVEPDLPPPPPQRERRDNAKYYIGAAAIAASTIAGIYLYRTRLKETPIEDFENAAEPINYYAFKLVEHAKDKVLEIFNKCPDLGFSNRVETVYQQRVRVDKNGKSILKKADKVYKDRGLKRIDRISRPGGAVQSKFVRADGSVRAQIDWDDDGNLFKYFIKDDRGNIVRDYNYTNEGLSTKTYYNKENIKMKEVCYNGKGWTYERNYDDNGSFLDQYEIKPELKNPSAE